MRALDGVRGLALAAVLAYHVAPGVFPGGFLGVDAFFVLSGFLLTSILVDEHRQTGAIDRRAYGRRRVRRLGPALLTLLATLILVVPVLAAGDAHRLRGDVVSSLFGVTNWHLIASGSSYFTHLGRPSFVQHLWSVAIEIQFYVLCPWIVGALVRLPRALARALVGLGVVASATAMALMAHGPASTRAYYGTDTRVGALLLGMLLALLITADARRAVVNGRPGRRVKVVGGTCLILFVAVVVSVNERAAALYPWGFLATQLIVVALIAAALRPGPLARAMAQPAMRWLGQRSYGIYLWHWPVVILLRPGVDVTWPRWATVMATVSLSLLLGELSYRFVEQPFMRSRPSPASRRRLLLIARRGAVATACVGLAVVLIRIPTTDNIAASLHAGERALATDPFSTVEATDPLSSSTTTAAAGPATSLAAASHRDGGPAASRPVSAAAGYSPHLAPPAPGSVPVVAVGDSVMLGAANALESRLGSSGHIDARVGRQFDEGIKVIHSLREQGRLGRVVVVHLGNNGTVRASQIDTLMHELDSVDHVLLLTVRVDASWQNSVNQTMHDAAARYSKVKLVDWYSYSTGHSNWFWSDNTHLRPAGASAYADLVAGSVPPPPPPPPPPSTTTTSTTSTTAPPTTTTSSTTTSTTAPPTTTTSSTTSTTLLKP